MIKSGIYIRFWKPDNQEKEPQKYFTFDQEPEAMEQFYGYVELVKKWDEDLA